MLAHLNLIALCTTGKCKKQCGKAPVGSRRIRKVGVWQAVGEAMEKNFGLASTQERKSGLGSRELWSGQRNADPSWVYSRAAEGALK